MISNSNEDSTTTSIPIFTINSVAGGNAVKVKARRVHKRMEFREFISKAPSIKKTAMERVR